MNAVKTRADTANFFDHPSPLKYCPKYDNAHIMLIKIAHSHIKNSIVLMGNDMKAPRGASKINNKNKNQATSLGFNAQ